MRVSVAADLEELLVLVAELEEEGGQRAVIPDAALPPLMERLVDLLCSGVPGQACERCPGIPSLYRMLGRSILEAVPARRLTADMVATVMWGLAELAEHARSGSVAGDGCGQWPCAAGRAAAGCSGGADCKGACSEEAVQAMASPPFLQPLLRELSAWLVAELKPGKDGAPQGMWRSTQGSQNCVSLVWAYAVLCPASGIHRHEAAVAAIAQTLVATMETTGQLSLGPSNISCLCQCFRTMELKSGAVARCLELLAEEVRRQVANLHSGQTPFGPGELTQMVAAFAALRLDRPAVPAMLDAVASFVVKRVRTRHLNAVSRPLDAVLLLESYAALQHRSLAASELATALAQQACRSMASEHENVSGNGTGASNSTSIQYTPPLLCRFLQAFLGLRIYPGDTFMRSTEVHLLRQLPVLTSDDVVSAATAFRAFRYRPQALTWQQLMPSSPRLWARMAVSDLAGIAAAATDMGMLAPEGMLQHVVTSGTFTAQQPAAGQQESWREAAAEGVLLGQLLQALALQLKPPPPPMLARLLACHTSRANAQDAEAAAAAAVAGGLNSEDDDAAPATVYTPPARAQPPPDLLLGVLLCSCAARLPGSLRQLQLPPMAGTAMQLVFRWDRAAAVPPEPAAPDADGWLSVDVPMAACCASPPPRGHAAAKRNGRYPPPRLEWVSRAGAEAGGASGGGSSGAGWSRAQWVAVCARLPGGWEAAALRALHQKLHPPHQLQQRRAAQQELRAGLLAGIAAHQQCEVEVQAELDSFSASDCCNLPLAPDLTLTLQCCTQYGTDSFCSTAAAERIAVLLVDASSLAVNRPHHLLGWARLAAIAQGLQYDRAVVLRPEAWTGLDRAARERFVQRLLQGQASATSAASAPATAGCQPERAEAVGQPPVPCTDTNRQAVPAVLAV